MIDAMPKKYITEESTPYLFNFGKDQKESWIDPLFAFRGIETTFFTGKWPTSHGVWTEYELNNFSDKRALDLTYSKIINLTDLLYEDNLMSITRYLINRYIYNKATYNSGINLIPSHLTNYFTLTQNRSIFDMPDVNSCPTLFNQLTKSGIKYSITLPAKIGGDQASFQKILKNIEKKDEFNLYKIGILDKKGHKYGPDTKYFHLTLKQIDNNIKELVTKAEKYSETNVIIFSDHGMAPVNKRIDLFTILKPLKYEPLRDYLFFIDSTMVRFWFKDEKIHSYFRELLNKFTFGHCLTIDEYDILKIPRDPKYGQLVFVLDEGYIFHPDFFHKNSVMKGMHGYAYPINKEYFPFIMTTRNITLNEPDKLKVDFIDIYKIMLDSCSGKYN